MIAGPGRERSEGEGASLSTALRLDMWGHEGVSDGKLGEGDQLGSMPPRQLWPWLSRLPQRDLERERRLSASREGNSRLTGADDDGQTKR